MIDKIQVNFLGVSFEMGLHPHGELLSDIIRHKAFYSVNDLIIMRGLLREGDCFLDVGANIGWHSIFAARWVGATGRVRAFEPEASNFKLLTANLAGHANTELVSVALGDQPGSVGLEGSLKNMGNYRVLFDTDVSNGAVAMTTLDDYLSKNPDAGERVRYVKIDAQGCEPRILRGASTLIRRERPFVQAEFSPDHIRLCGDSIFDVLSFIDRNDYRPFWILEEVGLGFEQILKPISIAGLIALAQGLAQKESGIDLLLVPAERLDELSSASRTS
jgi:FkbM family methyltransferase